MATSGKAKPQETSPPEIPTTLIYEEMDGQPIYYQGYEKVLKGEETVEGIMGSSSLQTKLAALILKHLFMNLDSSKWEVFPGEAGMHLSKGNNLASDIAIYTAEQLKDYEFDETYFQIPPKVVIEIDTKADLSQIKWEHYLRQKNEKLLAWGVERIIWILTASEQVILVEPNQDWRTRDWHKPVTIVESCEVKVGELLTN